MFQSFRAFRRSRRTVLRTLGRCRRIFRVEDSRDWNIDSLSQRGSFEYSWNLTKGTYYISADRIRSNTTGTYSFSLGHKSANETFSEAQGGSNNNSDDADQIELNKTYKGQLAFNDDEDWYKFTVPKKETVKVIGRSQRGVDSLIHGLPLIL